MKDQDKQELKPMNINIYNAPACFYRVKMPLATMWGSNGTPLIYVIRTKLILEDPNDDPGFGEESKNYLSIDDKLTASAPILGEDANENNDKNELETSGPWHPTFASNARNVWSVLLAFFSGNGSWHHVKKHQQTQNG